MERETLSIREAATVLGIAEGTVRALIKKHQFPVLRLGGRLLIPREGLKRLLSEAATAGRDQ